MTELNASQKEAVQHSEGPLLVIAGPGSGKTRIVAHRIARLVSELEVPARHILAITFTNKAAKEMRGRVASLLGEDHTDATSLWMGTFHSMCNRILRKHAQKIGFPAGFHIYDQTDTENALVDVCVSMGATRKDARRAARDLCGEISRVKSEGGSASSMAEVRKVLGTDRRPIPLPEVFEQYQQYLKSNAAMDFDDLLLKTVELFDRFPEVLESYQQRFQHVFIDEYQDTNRVQNDLVMMLAAPQNNICAVGDPDQSIYRFRGAEIRNILELGDHFPEIKIVDMGENYRSVPAIVETASTLIAHNPRVFDRKLASQRTREQDDGAVSFEMFPDSWEENDWIAETIASQVSNGRNFSDFAVLYRKHSLAEPLENSLIRTEIPYKISGGTSFFERAEIRDCLAMMRCASGNADPLAVKRIAKKAAKGLGEKSIEKLETHAKSKGTPLTETLLLPAEAGLKGKSAAAAEKFGKLIAEASTAMSEEGPAASLQAFLREYEDPPTGDNNTETASAKRIEQFGKLIAEHDTYDEMRDMLALSAGEFNADGTSPENPDSHVSLMTYHASKGLEFPVVFLMAMEEDIMLPAWAGTEKEDEEEARRLVYVGATRAEDRLYITAAEDRPSDYAGGAAKEASRFWEEMGGPATEEKSYFGEDGMAWLNETDTSLRHRSAASALA